MEKESNKEEDMTLRAYVEGIGAVFQLIVEELGVAEANCAGKGRARNVAFCVWQVKPQARARAESLPSGAPVFRQRSIWVLLADALQVGSRRAKAC